MNNIIKLVLVTGLLAVSQLAYSEQLTDTYRKGDVLTADKLNNIKTVINNVEARVTTVEGGTTEIAVDCDADGNAFLGFTIKDNTTYTLDGTCNGPIEIFRKRNVVIQGNP